MVPFLTLAMGVPIHNAIAASIVAVIATSSAAAAIYLGNRITNLRLGVTLEVTTTIGGILGGLTAVSLDRTTLTLVFALSLVGVAVAMARQTEVVLEVVSVPEAREEGDLGGCYHDPNLRRDVRYRVRWLPLGLGFSALAGLLSGLLGIGGGIVKVPTMVLGMRVPVKAAVATSNFMIGVTAAASAYIYYSAGLVDPPVTSAVAVGVFLGSLAGARWAPHIHRDILSRGFALMLIVVAALMVLSVLGVY